MGPATGTILLRYPIAVAEKIQGLATKKPCIVNFNDNKKFIEVRCIVDLVAAALKPGPRRQTVSKAVVGVANSSFFKTPENVLAATWGKAGKGRFQNGLFIVEQPVPAVGYEKNEC